jgi:hypothetical protein
MSRVSCAAQIPPEIQPLFDRFVARFENQARALAHSPPVFRHVYARYSASFAATSTTGRSSN